MGKPARARRLSDTQALAVGRLLRISPRELATLDDGVTVVSKPADSLKAAVRAMDTITAFCASPAGGGAKGGLRYGATDDYGYYAAENKVHIHDLHATILHLLGLDHEKLTYRYAGRDFRLTDVAGEVVRPIIA